MLVLLLAYLGGILTIISPCILPVLPFVFARAGKSFARSVLPLLAGMALMFTLVATLAAVGGAWVVKANEYGRWLALVLLALFALALLLPHLAERLTAPLVSIGNRLAETAQDGAQNGKREAMSSFLLGIATGLLWAPCAGPILGLVLTGAALGGASLGTTLLLFAYAAGAATSLALALLVGGRLFAAMKRSLGAGEWVRRGLGLAMLAGVVAIAMGWDTGVLTRVSIASTSDLEQSLIERFHKPTPVSSNTAMMAMSANVPSGDAPSNAMQASNTMMMQGAAHDGAAPSAATTQIANANTLGDEGPMPSLDGAVQWLNSPPLTAQALRGKVVLIDFWTYSCINCLRTLPYVKAWADKYSKQGLVVIGVHAPEFAFERNVDNVKKAMRELGVTYPVAIDNNYAIWRAFGNQYWPAHYFIDAKGRIRYHHFGEGGEAESEHVIQQLLREAGAKQVGNDLSDVQGKGAQLASDSDMVDSPETYIGYGRAENFVGTVKRDQSNGYTAPSSLALNQWALSGAWTVGEQRAVLDQAGGRIVYHFKARDLHLVLGLAHDGKPVRFRITIDGHAPGADHGMDAAADGTGKVTEQRLYQLVRQHGDMTDHTFSIEFLDPGVAAYAFTFG